MMSSTLIRRTARLTVLVGALPLAAALTFGGGAANAVPVVKAGPTISHGANTTTDNMFLPVEGQTAGNGGTAKGIASRVGRADDKMPLGQSLNDHNNGYECDGNMGIARGNPAHSNLCGAVNTEN